MSPVPIANRDSPDKHDEEDNEIGSMDAPDFIIAAGSSEEDESDEEADPHQGYQLLPQEPGGMDTGGMDTEEDYAPPSPTLNAVDQVIVNSMEASDYVGGFGSSMFDVPETSSTEAIERREVWKDAKETEQSRALESDKVEEIRAVMAGFTLPPSSQPDWARAVPEQEWKTQLVQQLRSGSRPQRAERKQNKDSKDCNIPSTSKSSLSKSQSSDNK